MIKLYVLAFLALSLFIGYIAYKIGKEKTVPEKKIPDKTLDEKIEEIKKEIVELSTGLPIEIEKNSKRIEYLKKQLEEINKLKFN